MRVLKTHIMPFRAFVASCSAVFMLLLGAPAGASAGQAELDLLTSYIGSWSGSGELEGGEEPETLNCRMTITKGTGVKINYAGRCSLAGMNLSVAGTIAYNDAASRYEGVMTSNTAFSGVAIGRKSGDRISFDLRERNTDEKGRDLTIDSRIILNGGTVTVDFDVTFNESGETMHTSVPFART